MKNLVGVPDSFEFEILGEPASKSNSRRIIFKHRKPRSIKSVKALDYVDQFNKQCPVLDPLFTGDVFLEIDIFYASRRPDLDESLILDAMQGRIYLNDRQVKRRLTTWHLDRDNPRAIIRVEPLRPDSH